MITTSVDVEKKFSVTKGSKGKFEKYSNTCIRNNTIHGFNKGPQEQWTLLLPLSFSPQILHKSQPFQIHSDSAFAAP